MNKIRIIDLLNKIANGEEVPKKIKFYGKYYIWYDNRYTGNEGYCLEPLKSDSNSFLEINTVYDLNNEVEIIEEEKKIPKKLEYYDDSIAWVIDDVGQLSDVDKVIIDKLNDVIDYLKSKGDK